MASAGENVLLFGKDARTDALAEGIRRSATCEMTICAPFRSPGLVAKADRFVLTSLSDLGAMVAIAREVSPDFAVVGPEDPLALGLADALADLGVPCFGPVRSLAQVETSKSWARALVERYGIGANPRHRAFRSADGLAEFAVELGQVVVKPDGLTGGKGVKVQGEQLESLDEAVAYALALLRSDGAVVVEERLEGEEFSLQTITDGEAVLHCPLVQDHKRAYAGDTGPNTGGMGSYSCPDGALPFLCAEDVDRAHRVNEAVLEALAKETGVPYRGVLYGGFMAVAGGVRLIEYNARFGDPEAMNVLPLLEGDVPGLLRAAATGRLGRLGRADTAFASRATVCKYVVPGGYPEGPVDEDTLLSADDSVLGEDLRRYWAACELSEDARPHLTGSRSLAFLGLGGTLRQAEELAERGAQSVSGAVRHRPDIGTGDALRRRLEHMERIRSATPA